MNKEAVLTGAGTIASIVVTVKVKSSTTRLATKVKPRVVKAVVSWLGKSPVVKLVKRSTRAKGGSNSVPGGERGAPGVSSTVVTSQFMVIVCVPSPLSSLVLVVDWKMRVNYGKRILADGKILAIKLGYQELNS